MGECQSACNVDLFRQEPRIPMEQSVRIEYTGEKFVIPEELRFDKQATFAKVEQAARAFCQSTPLLTEKTTSRCSTRRC